MVTVIADKEELTTPVNNGVTGSSNDNERPFQYIKDYQEVDFHRSASCKPLPEDLFGINDGQTAKSSIQGTFFVQVDGIEPVMKFSNNNNNQTEQTNDNNSLLLTLSDGITTVKGITNDYIPDLSFNIRPGCKLLLTGVIPINDGILQLTHDNTRFQYGSNTYPRPRSAYRGRGGGGSYRPSYEGRRGGGGNGNSNTRYDNDDGESNFFKRPPPKNTLMDFMTSFKISDDIKQPIDNENQKFKDRNDNKRRNNEQYYKTNNGVNTTNTLTTSNPNHYYQPNNTTNQITFQQDGINEQLDSEDDPSHSNYRERRNPLPPRLQRAQEERSRRNTNRYYDESGVLIGNEINGNYRNSTTNNHSLSSSSTYLRRGDQTTYIPNNSSTGQQHATTLNSYAPHANMLAAVNNSTQTHLAYYQTNPGALAYSLAGIPSPPFHSQQPPIGPSYTNDHLTFCYGAPYATPTYLPPSVTNGFNGDSKTYNQNNPSVMQGNSFVDETEGTTTTTTTNESHQDDNNDSENKSQTSSNEQKATSSSISSNDDTNNSQQIINEQSEDKSRDSNSNSRPRWKIGDMCLARWSEDREFYIATIVQIQSSYCTVLFRDYNNYDRVHFSDLKILPRDQQFYPFVQSVAAPSSELNALAASAYFPARPNYYPPTMDGCIMMPEAPPFPFNSAGTLYMCPPPITSVPRSNRYNTNCFQQPIRRVENGNINNTNPNGDTTISSSSTPPSKDSNDTSIIDSTTTSNDDNHQSLLTRDIQLCSIADAPLTLVTKDDEGQRSTSTESLTSSKDDEQPTTNEDEEGKQENNSVVNVV